MSKGGGGGRGGDEEDLGGRRFFGWRLGFGRPDDAVGNEGGLAAGFVGVDAVIAHRLLALGRDVEKRGGDEVGGFENFEVASGVVVAFGAVDDGLGGGVPGDLLEGVAYKGFASRDFSLSERTVKRRAAVSWVGTGFSPPS